MFGRKRWKEADGRRRMMEHLQEEILCVFSVMDARRHESEEVLHVFAVDGDAADRRLRRHEFGEE